MFTKNDNITQDDIIVLTQALNNTAINIIGWVRAREVVDLYEEPISYKIAQTKKVLYYRTIKKIIKDIEELKYYGDL